MRISDWSSDVCSSDLAEYRQLAVIDDDGFAAARTGTHNRDWAGHHVRDNFIALGNVLVGEDVLDAIERGFDAAPEAPLEDRLMQAVEAGRDAGGPHGGQNYAALLVYADPPVPPVHLRGAVHTQTGGALRRVSRRFR